MPVSVVQVDNNSAVLSVTSLTSFNLFTSDLVTGQTASLYLPAQMMNWLAQKLQKLISKIPALVLAQPAGFLASLYTLGDSSLAGSPTIAVNVVGSMATVIVSGYTPPANFIFTVPHSISPTVALDQSSGGGGTIPDASATVAGKVNLVAQTLGAGVKNFQSISVDENCAVTGVLSGSELRYSFDEPKFGDATGGSAAPGKPLLLVVIASGTNTVTILMPGGISAADFVFAQPLAIDATVSKWSTETADGSFTLTTDANATADMHFICRIALSTNF